MGYWRRADSTAATFRAATVALTGLVGAAFAVMAPQERAVIVHEVNVRAVNVRAAGDALPDIAAVIKARLTEVPDRAQPRRGSARR